VRQKFDEKLVDLVENKIASACVADGRGSHEPYLVRAEKNGMQVIRILVDADYEVRAERYYQDYLRKQQTNNPNFQETPELRNQVLEEFKQTIVQRDERDAQTIQEQEIGLISPDSGILDTSHKTPQEVLETALTFISEQLSANSKSSL
jgi:cytidylate kinase